MNKLTHLVLALLFNVSVFGAIPSRWEPAFSKAVLDFHDGKYTQALEKIERLPTTVRQEKEARELRALTLKQMGKWREAAREYLSLLRAKQGDTRPYEFELGVISFEQEKYGPAKRLLESSYRKGFNRAAATYFLGIIAMERKQFDRAETMFRYVSASNVKSLRPLANLYLAQIAARSNRTLASLQQFNRANEQARLQLRDPNATRETLRISRKVVAAAEKVMMSMRQSYLVFNVGLLAGYDSNVLFTANNTTSPAEGPSGRGSLQNSIQYGASYSTAALAKWQTILNYQGAFTYNFNRVAEQGDFLNNDLAFFITRAPLGKFTYGGRIGVNGSFRNALDSTTNSNRLRTYLLASTIGPYVQYSITENLRIGGELFYHPRRFFLDSETTSSFQQTGAVYFSRVYLRNHTGAGYFNPAVYLSGNVSHTRGIEYRSRGLNLGISNRFHLSGKSVLAGFFSLGQTGYKAREGQDRFDVPTSVGVNYVYRIRPNLDLFGDLVYTYNFSNIATPYEYNRYQLALSGTYRF